MSNSVLPLIHSLCSKPALRVAVFGLALSSLPLLHAETLEPAKVIEHAIDHGSAKPDEVSTITVHVKLRDQAGFDHAVSELYRPGSPTFHKWMTPEEISRFGAAPEDLATVQKELESHGLSVIESDNQFSTLRVRGTTTQFEEAFQTKLHEFERAGDHFHANVSPARLTGRAGDLVKAVDGLTNMPMKPHYAVQKDPKTGKAREFIKVKEGTAPVFSHLFTDNCFTSSETIQLTTEANPPLPSATYTGNIYDASGLPCGYTPSELQVHYGLQKAYKAGYEGAGQTIVLVDGPSYGTQVKTDLANYAHWTGLPAITKNNFAVGYPDGPPSPIELAYIADWTTEADLDVQAAHAVAPLANIVLFIAPTQDWSELEYLIQFSVKYKAGNVISNSYGYPEFLWGYQTMLGFESALEVAAASGVTVNFSSGDSGDEGTGSPDALGASYPATSQYATAVGGTSIGILNVDKTTSEVGWGNNATFLSFGWNWPITEENLGFQGGSGGGESGYIAKPSWESSLPGIGRQEPDIAALADPYTGFIMVYYGQVGVIGGTSLASPVFSAITALASEKAGVPLGQLAPVLSTLPAGAITDVLPTSSIYNVSGTYYDTTGPTYYSPATLAGPLEGTTSFYSTLWDSSGDNEGDYLAFVFGTDSSLTVTPGWDNVTGWGVPNGLTFIDDLAAAATPAVKK
jgi:subtilase family serine protease